MVRSSSGKNKAGAVLRDYGYTMMENPSLVSHDGKITCKFPYATPTKHLDFAMKQINATSIVPKNLVIRQALQNTGIPPEIANVITDSWQNNNQKAI